MLRSVPKTLGEIPCDFYGNQHLFWLCVFLNSFSFLFNTSKVCFLNWLRIYFQISPIRLCSTHFVKKRKETIACRRWFAQCNNYYVQLLVRENHRIHSVTLVRCREVLESYITQLILIVSIIDEIIKSTNFKSIVKKTSEAGKHTTTRRTKLWELFHSLVYGVRKTYRLDRLENI